MNQSAVAAELPIAPKTNPNIRPWVRLFARSIDLSIHGGLIGLLIGILVVIAMGCGMITHEQVTAFFHAPIYSLQGLSYGIILIILSLPIEAILLHKFGYTFGKWLLKVKVRDQNGEQISWLAAFKRSLGVIVYGMALGIPILSLITQISAYTDLVTRGHTRWDKSDNLIVTHESIGSGRWVVAILILLIVQSFALLPYIKSIFH